MTEPALTILQLDTRFPRIAGDVGCPQTYAQPVEITRIARATVQTIVSNRPDLVEIAPFEQGLTDAKADLVATSCGFLSYWQEHLAAVSHKQFISSSLTALDSLCTQFKPGEIMILTFDQQSLTPQHLGRHHAYAAGIVGLPKDTHLRQVIEQDRDTLDADRAAQELVGVVNANCTTRHKHLLLECTNLPPYKRALQAATGLPVTDILTLIETAKPGTVSRTYA